jgi:membrane protease subunit (stomatin/prohibitin family)
MSYQRQYQKEPGDWTCNHCGKSNFKKRASCYGCRKSKYSRDYARDPSQNHIPQYHSHANAPQPGEQLHRDWMCPICDFKVYGSKKSCKKCNTKRPDLRDDNNIPPSPSHILPPSNDNDANRDIIVEPREGDWTCPKCTDYQFAKNKFCRSCGTPNPANPNDNAEDLESTDECVICMDKPKNATLIHGDCGHSCCCLECARSLHANRGNCPICRREIEKVIQNFT